MGKETKRIMAIALIFTVIFFSFVTVRIAKEVNFDTSCAQYIKRAADASTVETAKEELGRAISFAEENGYTEGIVSIFLRQPKNDIGYWYKMLKETYNELDSVADDATQLEKTNILMKVREALTDEHEHGVVVTVPDGIGVYPNNLLYFLWGMISFLMGVGLWIAVPFCYLKWD